MNEDDLPSPPTSLVDLMAELVPPPEPAPISLVPQTIGWPIMALLILGIGVLILRRHWHIQRAEGYRDAALRALDAAGSDPAVVGQILRQTALTAFPRADVAGLYGADWLGFLDKTSGETRFQTGPGRVLATAPYRSGAVLPPDTLDLVRDWILHHQRTPDP